MKIIHQSFKMSLFIVSYFDVLRDKYFPKYFWLSKSINTIITAVKEDLPTLANNLSFIETTDRGYREDEEETRFFDILMNNEKIGTIQQIYQITIIKEHDEDYIQNCLVGQ